MPISFRTRVPSRACCLLLGSLLASSPAQASLPDLFSLGTRAPALAGTGAATATGFEATYLNPAGLWQSGRRLSLGAVYGRYAVSLDGEPYEIRDTAGLVIGGAFTLPLEGMLRDRIGIGLSLYTPFAAVNRAYAPFPDQDRAALLDSRSQIVSVLLGAGVRLPRGVSVGAGVIALAALVGTIAISPDGTGRIASVSEQQLTVDFAPVIGVRWRGLADRLALGLVYRAESKSSYRLQVNTSLGDSLPVTLPTILFAGVAQFDPHQLAVELAYQLRPSLGLTLQLQWKHWSAYSYPVLPATMGAAPLPNPDFHDTLLPRAALEFFAWSSPALILTLRAGYFFEWSPAPDPAVTNLLDPDRHVLTAGLSLHRKGRIPVEISAFGQAHLLGPHSRLSGVIGVAGLALGIDL